MDRSRAYPVVDLGRSIADTVKVQENLGRGAHDRDSIAKALGYASGVGLGARRVAALVHYGLMNRLPEGNYELSGLAKEVLHPVGDDVDAKQRAALNPKLFREVYDRLTPNGRIPTQLANILVRDFGVTSQAAEDVARIFKETMSVAWLMESDGRLLPAGSAPPTSASANDEPQRDDALTTNQRQQPDRVVETAPPVAAADYQTVEIKLSGGMASLRLPQRLSELDLRKLKKYIELLELDIID